MLFRHKSYDSAGRTVSGMVDADSVMQASSRLKKKGLFPFEIEEELEKHDAGRVGRRFRTSRPAEITAFTRQMATLLAAGIPLLECLFALSEQANRGFLKRAIVSVKEKVSSGLAFSEALGEYPGLFPPVYVGLIRAGEISGELDAMMEGLAELREKQELIRSKVLTALIYPFTMTLIGALVLAVLFIAVVPKIVSIFANMGQELPLPTKMLVLFSDFFQAAWPFIFIVLVLLCLGGYKFYETKKGRAFTDMLFLKLPLWGTLACYMDISRFAGSLSLLLKGGIPITEAFDISKNVVYNVHMSGMIEEARENLVEGGDISSVFRQHSFVPPIAIKMITVGEKSGRLEEMLLYVSNALESQVMRTAEALTSVLEPVLIVAMGGIVGFIALAILLPIFEMNQLVGL